MKFLHVIRAVTKIFPPFFTHFNSMCVLGNRLLKDIDIGNCTKDRGSGLYNIFCENGECDEYFRGKFFLLVLVCFKDIISLIHGHFFSLSLSSSFNTTESNVTIRQGIRGLESGVLFENLMPSFLEVIKSETILSLNFCICMIGWIRCEIDVKQVISCRIYEIKRSFPFPILLHIVWKWWPVK